MHPTVKPVALVADAILDCSKRKGIVLDAFAGSGTTLVAAERTGRRGYGIELDPLYCDVIVRRLAKISGVEAIHVETGKSFTKMAAERAAARAGDGRLHLDGKGPARDLVQHDQVDAMIVSQGREG